MSELYSFKYGWYSEKHSKVLGYYYIYMGHYWPEKITFISSDASDDYKKTYDDAKYVGRLGRLIGHVILV